MKQRIKILCGVFILTILLISLVGCVDDANKNDDSTPEPEIIEEEQKILGMIVVDKDINQEIKKEEATAEENYPQVVTYGDDEYTV